MRPNVQAMSNQSSSVTEFLLRGFSDTEELQSLHFIAFLIIYLLALIENLLIITVIIYSHQLHKPMYFFLANLALQDLGSISVSVPKSMANSLMNTKTISYNGCICQVFFFVFFTVSHFFLLGIMAYDRYVAICNPLHYETMMNKKACIQMAISVWITGLLCSAVYTGSTFTIEFCSNDINQFFCEIPELFKIACSDTYLIALCVLYVGASVAFINLILIVYSYVQIFRSVLRIPSTQGKQKAFSTCLPHLIVISLYFVSGTFAYLKPTSMSLSSMDLVVSMFYCMLPPIMNPFIYSIRNRELKMAFWNLTVNLFPHFLANFHWSDDGF
ncbi:olfactory receptor 14A16-like isoform X2 [Rhineura floridana]|uniref:olfactory receptor 14A16-like isoform X2 n=1 Tax=Rhineura floridana TaxID=261503 RepID=UPI002AC7E717|nr:olfactory receptor 14A16-like isoform X2 [Rhineura floridana]XP_061444793.1 olfactory receptor 14A16-like isoform X2 [Rhineura floridana]